MPVFLWMLLWIYFLFGNSNHGVSTVIFSVKCIFLPSAIKNKLHYPWLDIFDLCSNSIPSELCLWKAALIIGHNKCITSGIIFLMEDIPLCKASPRISSSSLAYKSIISYLLAFLFFLFIQTDTDDPLILPYNGLFPKEQVNPLVS